MNNILTDLRNAIIDDKHPWDITLYERAISEIEKWKSISDGLYEFAILVLGDYMTNDSVKAYEKAVCGD